MALTKTTVLSTVLLTFLGTFGLFQYAWQLPVDHDVRVDFTPGEVSSRSAWRLMLGEPAILQTCCADSVAEVADSGARDGHAMAFHLRFGSPSVKGSQRAEIRMRPDRMRDEVWYAGRVKVPQDWQPSPTAVLALQWHDTRDLFIAEPGRPPALRIEIVGKEWSLVKHWDTRQFSRRTATGVVEGGTVLRQLPLEPGQWTDWRFHVKWSFQDDGFIKIWKDGTLVVDDHGPNAFNDLHGPYMKAGVYVPDWASGPDAAGVETRTLLIDHLTNSTRMR